ncbi:MAG: hypothetical protein ACXW4Q_11935 [Anaerolineales bacterium]
MSNSPKSRIDPTILAALIGVCGTVMVTLITLALPRFTAPPTPTAPPTASWTPVSISTSTIAPSPVPTHTVPAGDPSSTPAPDTPTPEPTFTPALPKIGEDWANDCISEVWIPFPSVDTTVTNGCRSQPIHSLFAANGRLEFVIQGRFDNTEQYGMFAPLPANGTASIDMFLTTLQDGEVWVGVFSAPDLNSQGMIMVIPPGDVKNRLLVQKAMPGQAEMQSTASFAQSSAIYNVVFEVGNGSVTTRIMRDTVFDPVPINSAQQWLFVGYQVKKGNNRMQAAFLNLLVQGQ